MVKQTDLVPDLSGAEFDGPYRYRLWRIWDPDQDQLLGVLLNPSVAGATWESGDMTVSKFVGFARRLGFGGMEIVNMYAFRTTDPKVLAAAITEFGEDYAIGPKNDATIIEACRRSKTVMAAWGSQPFFTERANAVKKLLLANHPNVLCFGRTADGHPRHPSRLPYSAVPQVFT